MTLWLTNLLAYSVQLAVLVAAGAMLIAALRVHTPRATLRFWQLVFATSLLWPACQLLADARNSATVTGVAFSSIGGWSTGVAPEIRAAIGSLDTDVAMLTVALLATGAATRLLWIGLGLLKLRVICAASTPADSLSPIAGALGRELGVAADIRFSKAIASPATVGAAHPTILLPERVCALPPDVQRAVLCHELVHVRRRDWPVMLGEELWCALLWFHPAARALASRLNLARETLVDEASILHTGDRRAYAAALLEFSTAGPRLPGATAFIGRRHLERRIALIAQEDQMSRSSLAIRLTVAATLLAAVTLGVTSTVPLTASLHAQSEKVYKPGQDEGVTLPQVVREVKPVYTAAAMQAKIQGAVWLTAVVLSSGDVGEVTVVKSLDTEHGLDDEAVKAARQWKFEPGTKDGKPVPTEVTIELRFTLKKDNAVG